MKKNNKYFSHDCNARNDEKMLAVRMRHGVEGYGIYFMLLERLRDEADYTGVKDYNVIAFDLRVSAEKIKSIVEDFKLFEFTEDGKRFYSKSFLNRMSIKDLISQSKSDSGKKGALKKWQNDNEMMANAMKIDGKQIANAIKEDGKTMAIKVKESKVKEIKVNISLSDFFKIQKEKFEKLNKDDLETLKILGIEKPLVYTHKYLNNPPMDFLEVVLETIRDEEWKHSMKNDYGEGINDSFRDFVRRISKAEYDTIKYVSASEFKTHFLNHYRKNKK